MVLEKTLESPLDCKEIQPVYPKGHQSWVSIGRTDAEAETPILWLPDAKSWLIGKDSDAGKDWRQEEKGMTEDEMAVWHHRLDGHEFEWTPSWWWTGRPGLPRFMGSQRVRQDWTELNWTELSYTLGTLYLPVSNCNNLVPRKDRKGGVGREAVLTMDTGWVSFSYQHVSTLDKPSPTFPPSSIPFWISSPWTPCFEWLCLPIWGYYKTLTHFLQSYLWLKIWLPIRASDRLKITSAISIKMAGICLQEYDVLDTLLILDVYVCVYI